MIKGSVEYSFPPDRVDSAEGLRIIDIAREIVEDENRKVIAGRVGLDAYLSPILMVEAGQNQAAFHMSIAMKRNADSYAAAGVARQYTALVCSVTSRLGARGC
ncbi:MAG: hypothetical protein JWM52_73 [Candidatus Saccharibacteria bacterium]|nr:hypothetical protein [Candidatus Saccharibacteria bacterium]